MKPRIQRSCWLMLPLIASLLTITSIAGAAIHVITFTCCSYTPNDLTVAVGDTVEWRGAFALHPLHSTSVPVGADTFFSNAGSSYQYVVAIEGTYNYRCDNHFPLGMTGTFDAIITGVHDPQGVAGSYDLHQNFPNPFNPSTTIRFSVPTAQLVTLKIFNVLGNEVTTLVNERKPAGEHTVEFDGGGLPSGIYLYRLQAGDFTDTKKLLLIK